jgi:integrase
MARQPKAANTRNGITIRDLWKRKGRYGRGLRWLVRVWDPIDRDYTSQAYPDDQAAEAAAWGEQERARMVLGQTSAASCTLEAIGGQYFATIKESGVTKHYLRSVEIALAALKDGGATDLKDPDFEARVLRIARNLKARRKGQRAATPASSALKRRLLITAKAMCRWAASHRDRTGLMHNPLDTARLKLAPPPAKEVFTVPQLRALVSNEARFLPGKLRRETDTAIANANTNLEAALTLGITESALYARLQTPPKAEDPMWWYTVLGIYLGARPSEVRAATWGMVDWDNQDFNLPAHVEGNKTRQKRCTPIQPELAAILETVKEKDRNGAILPDAVASMDDSTLTRAFQRYARRCLGLETDADVPGPHTLRHCCGSLLIALRGGTLGQYQPDMLTAMHLGHSNVQQTKHYAMAAPSFKNDVKEWGGQFRLRDSPTIESKEPMALRLLPRAKPKAKGQVS